MRPASFHQKLKIFTIPPSAYLLKSDNFEAVKYKYIWQPKFSNNQQNVDINASASIIHKDNKFWPPVFGLSCINLEQYLDFLHV